MKSRQLEAFRAVILRQSITRAAEMLHITQPAVTRLILDLESEIGFSLFTREKGRLFPTADALLLYQEVERSFVGVERIAQAAQQIRSLTRGSLNIAAAPALALNLLPEWITDFTREHEGVAVSLLIYGTRLVGELVASEQCDIGLVTYTTWQPGVRLEALFKADMKCIVPKGHRLASKGVITPEDLAGEKFISFPRELDTRRIIDEIFAAQRIERVMSAECQLSAAIATFVARGAGVSIIDPVSTDYVTDEVSVHDFVPAIPFEYGIVTSDRQPPSRLASAFLAFVRERVNDRMRERRI
ncbi:LysR family transcriptional regulator [Burkholderia paludis]|uniref:LysR substrate-binding domain-containing protein n=1 Tax=Burkholderia paludis TaxID=1506587 RepID=UPI0004DB7485|nr:LysR substrate-binding domain-containing protein [Burkholderia paludis]KFG97825.1 LysR family transcriptional regulator [Burkholderia paludis]